MLEQQVDGLILVGSVFRERTGQHILAAAKSVPVVLINSFLPGRISIPSFGDEAEGVRKPLITW